MIIAFVIPLFISAAIMGGLAWYSASLRGVPGVRAFRLSLILTSIWSICYAVELLVPKLGAKEAASNLAFMAIAVLPLAWLATVMSFTGQGKKFTRLLPVFGIIPAISMIMLWTNPLHHLFSRVAYLDMDGVFPILKMIYGPWFWVHAGYTYILFAIAAGYLVGLLVRSSRRYIGQPLTLLTGMLIPLVWNVIYVTGIIPYRRLDLTPFLYSLSGLIFLVGLVYSRLFDVLPVARDVVMDAMHDAVIVADIQGRVVDLNQAARRVFGWQADHDLISRNIENVFADWPTVVKLLRAKNPQPVEMALKRDHAQFHYQVSLASLSDTRGYPLGRMLLLHDITERKIMEEELRRLSVTDPLTELGNRRKFFTSLESEFARAKRYHCDYCLIMLDLDHFKSINDRFSHLVGDEALKLTADAIRNSIRQTDIPVRYGGDEFGLLLPNTQLAGGLMLAGRLRDAIRQCHLSVGEHLTASVGVSVFHPDDKKSEDLLARADRALYQAKKSIQGIAVVEHPQRRKEQVG